MRSASEAWQRQITAHHEQSIRIQQQVGWSPENCDALAGHFVAGTGQEVLPSVQRVLRYVYSHTTVLDVGGGAGRFAIPLAARSARVTVVEPAISMADLLRRHVRNAGITNLFVVQSRWEDAEVEPAHTVICAHVLQEVRDAPAFIRKLNAHAIERVVVLSFLRSPLAQFGPFWEALYGEERLAPPALPELLSVLQEMGIDPDQETLPGGKPDTVDTREAALAVLRQTLFVHRESETDRRLQRIADDLLDVTAHGVAIRGAQPETEVLLSWNPR